MAEAAVNYAIDTLGSLLVQEIKFLGSAKLEIESIKSELESIRSFLKDADSRAAVEEEGEGNEGVLTWVKQVREEAHRIEDVLDEYTLEQAKLPHGSGLIHCLHRMCCFINELKLRHGIASNIEAIKSSLSNIQRRGQIYNFRSIDHGSNSGTRNVIPHDSQVDSFFVEDAEVVGIDSTRDKLIGWLVNERHPRAVIAVVGEGGLGKTTLAGKVFNNKAVKEHFDCQAWVTVGKEYIKKDLLKTIIQEFQRITGESATGEIDKIEEKDLIATLRECLKDKCYMIVFDDVWKIEFWRDVEHALLDNNKSSRIMLTTRRMNVADFCKTSSLVHIHELETLPPDEAWKLFCRKAFGSSSDGYCPSALEKLSRDIVSKCGGLPLAIVAVGGLLSTKNKVASEWRKLLDGLGSKLGNDPHLKSCNRVLLEGYYDLPHHLKSCLLYFGLFPESYSIKFGRLIRLWIAEGFVQYSKCPPSEQVAEEYLTELIDRSLVQVSGRKICGQPRSCRVHDLMHEIILKKSKELDFCRVLNGEDSTHCTKTRRVSIHRSTDSILESIKDSKIRSVFLFNVEKPPDSFRSTFVAAIKLVKVLDFEDAPIDYLPKDVGNLFHLHYLSVKNTKVKILPKSIGKLLNLETLNLKLSLVSELPIEIKYLKKLRNLLVFHLNDNGPYGNGAKIQEGFESLSDLRKLHYVHVNSDILEELGKLRQLRKLGIRLTNRNVNGLFTFFENMNNLESLIVTFTSREGILDIQSMVSPPQCLQCFILKGNIKKLPYWIPQLQNLIRIQLYLTGPTDDPIGVLQALPNLLQLYLQQTTYNDVQFHFKEGWFPKLQVLSLIDLRGLKWVIIDKGAIPNLRELRIGPLPLLEKIPTGIEHLRNLKILIFHDMLKKIYSMMKGKNWEKATKHIPEVRFTYKMAGNHFHYPTKDPSSISPEDLEQFIK